MHVRLALMHGDVVDAPNDVFFKQWSCNKPGAKLSAKACCTFLHLLQKQDNYHVSLGYLANNSNLIQIGEDDERDDYVCCHVESDGEMEEEEI